jgi:hypothetical protein
VAVLERWTCRHRGALLRTELRALVAGQVAIPIPDDAHEPDTAGNPPSAHQ